MFLKGIVRAKRYRNWDLKSLEICFLRNFPFATRSSEDASGNIGSVVVEVVALTARF
jgi:hypothetical protein